MNNIHATITTIQAALVHRLGERHSEPKQYDTTHTVLSY